MTTAAIEQIWEHIKRQDSRGCTALAVELSRRRSFGTKKKKKQRQGLPATQFRQTELSWATVLARSIARIFGWDRARITKATDACPRVTQVLNTWIQNMPKSVTTADMLLFCNAYPPRVYLALPSSAKVCPKAFQHGARAEDRALLRCEQHAHAALQHSEGNGGLDHSEGGDGVSWAVLTRFSFPFACAFCWAVSPTLPDTRPRRRL